MSKENDNVDNRPKNPAEDESLHSLRRKAGLSPERRSDGLNGWPPDDLAFILGRAAENAEKRFQEAENARPPENLIHFPQRAEDGESR